MLTREKKIESSQYHHTAYARFSNLKSFINQLFMSHVKVINHLVKIRLESDLHRRQEDYLREHLT